MTQRDIRLAKTVARDGTSLAQISGRAFDNDIHYGAPGPGGPPGYKSAEWQRKMMRLGNYFKILVDVQIVGGIIVFAKEPRCYELGRIFIDPDYQNQGIGTRAFEFLWQEYPLAKKWTLGTPAWNRRTRHFYSKIGFVEVGTDGRDGILFERCI
ncbi:MAG: GNAT family N-acetyltransferase [Anaerolineae bacterium]|nr:GNAT family N-acetyltransferase [Anaerolineae bacterium]